MTGSCRQIHRALAAGLVSVLACTARRAPEARRDAVADAPVDVGVASITPPSPWCGAGWSTLDEGTCFFVPSALVSPITLLVFVHGMIPDGGSVTEHQALVRSFAEARGAVAVFPRGRQGLCTWDARVADWWCWPTRRASIDGYAQAIASDWASAQSILETELGARFDRRYLIGFSNGGYFVAYLALERWVDADGFAVVGAGRSSIEEAYAARAARSVYIAVGDQEVPTTILGAENLGAFVAARRWPSSFVIHTTRGHEIHADDLDAAWRLWTEPRNDDKER